MVFHAQFSIWPVWNDPAVPFQLPFALLVWPLFRATNVVRAMGEDCKVKSQLFTVLLVVWSFFVMNLPYALLLVTETTAQLTQVSIFFL